MRTPGGYDTALVHRIVFHAIYGYLPEVVRHRCDNPPCYNPAHLLPGTMADNSRDMVDRGRSCRGEKRPNSILTEPDVLEIKRRLDRGESEYVMAPEYGVHPSTIGSIARGQTWAWLFLEDGGS